MLGMCSVLPIEVLVVHVHIHQYRCKLHHRNDKMVVLLLTEGQQCFQLCPKFQGNMYILLCKKKCIQVFLFDTKNSCIDSAIYVKADIFQIIYKLHYDIIWKARTELYGRCQWVEARRFRVFNAFSNSKNSAGFWWWWSKCLIINKILEAPKISEALITWEVPFQ